MPDSYNKSEGSKSSGIEEVFESIFQLFDTPGEVIRAILILAVAGTAYFLYTNEEVLDTVIKSSQNTIDPILPAMYLTSTILTIVFITCIIYVFIRWREVQNIEYIKYRAMATSEVEAKERNVQWFRVQQHIESEHPAEWRLAILSADTILETILREQGYEGDTTGERLKAVDQAELPSLSMAWEAHKLRNRVAHEGVHFEITKREARRVIALYERVFTDFKYL